MQAIDAVNVPAFVVVPTLDLVDQWIDALQTFDITIGEYTGREKEVEPITVSTLPTALGKHELHSSLAITTLIQKSDPYL